MQHWEKISYTDHFTNERKVSTIWSLKRNYAGIPTREEVQEIIDLAKTTGNECFHYHRSIFVCCYPSTTWESLQRVFNDFKEVTKQPLKVVDGRFVEV